MEFKTTPLKPFGVVIEPKNKNTPVSTLSIETLRPYFNQHQLVLLRGFSTFESSDQFAEYCELWGEISVWPFGKVLELIEQENPKDHIFDSSYVPMHWDGMYRPQVPEYQIFHCVTAPLSNHGGRTTFSNTPLVLKNTPAATKELWGKITGIYKRQMEFYNSKTVSPIITRHPHKEFAVIRYNEPHADNKGRLVNPVDMEFTGVSNSDLEQFHHSLQQALYAPENFYAHEWQKGDIVITDNFTLLHGREEFVSRSPRHIQRVQVLSNPPFNNPGLESYK